MSYVSNKIREVVDEELRKIRDDLLQLCILKDINIKKEIMAYFKNI